MEGVDRGILPHSLQLVANRERGAPIGRGDTFPMLAKSQDEYPDRKRMPETDTHTDQQRYHFVSRIMRLLLQIIRKIKTQITGWIRRPYMSETLPPPLY